MIVCLMAQGLGRGRDSRTGWGLVARRMTFSNVFLMGFLFCSRTIP